MSKLGVSYNVYDGIELLQHSINCIREHVDYINVVWQEVSNWGEKDATVLDQLKAIDGIDQLIKYTPLVNVSPTSKEQFKRNMGLYAAVKNRCDIFATMDCDEMYVGSEFANAYRLFIESRAQASACQMQTYYKFCERVISPAESYWVPLFCRVDYTSALQQCQWPVPADPTRKIPAARLVLYDRDQIQMHHYSFIRKDIGKKLRNSSAAVNWRDRINERVKAWESYTGGVGEVVMHPHNATSEFRPLTLLQGNPPVIIDWATIGR